MLYFLTDIYNTYIEATLRTLHTVLTHPFLLMNILSLTTLLIKKVIMLIRSSQLRSGIISMIDSANTPWKFSEGIPKEDSKKWDKYDGLIVLILSGVHFSILAIQREKSSNDFKYIHLCNEGRTIPAFYLQDLSKMDAVDITPRSGIRNQDGVKCAYYALKFVEMLISFGTEMKDMDQYYIKDYMRGFNDDDIQELHQWLING